MEVFKNFGIQQNVQLNVYDEMTRKLIRSVQGHNSATNSMLTGIAHYLIGEGILNQGWDTLRKWIPRYISLGTMGLYSQEEDTAVGYEGLPKYLGSLDPTVRTYNIVQAGTEYTRNDILYARASLPAEDIGPVFVRVTEVGGNGEILSVQSSSVATHESYTGSGAVITYNIINDDKARCIDYLSKQPGFGADGYDANLNNYREFFGLGPTFDKRPSASSTDNQKTVDCELLKTDFQRSSISFRNIIPESSAEIAKTVDVVFSAMISTGQLAQFREEGKDYIFITEAGLWSNSTWQAGTENGCLAAYRITYHDQSKMTPEAMEVEANRKLLKQSILRVGKNQVVQVVWKIQIGSIDEFGGRIPPNEIEWRHYYDDIPGGDTVTEGTYIRYHDHSYKVLQDFNKSVWDTDKAYVTLVTDDEARWNQN